MRVFRQICNFLLSRYVVNYFRDNKQRSLTDRIWIICVVRAIGNQSVLTTLNIPFPNADDNCGLFIGNYKVHNFIVIQVAAIIPTNLNLFR